ncbi:YfbM family protein [Lysobacter sp. BMK333-48F3]|uniref:YfbM family protein n=1 Tax=Lysobacter sp. BMK333-48F3 TaxID=2867962 RepID=UPI001C8B3D9C|nr:YfbM family protein [Lysobacter sp. BMK333-48F3]MBX9400559.1 YfbM family protein [Lysobacter sp. BMK333-48F3]
MGMIGNFAALSPAQLQTLLDDPGAVHSFIYPDEDEPENHLDIDKAWHAIHYTLNGSAWEGEAPLFLAVLGGQAIGEDVGYGPVRYLSPVQVQAVSAALSAIDAAQFGARFSPAALDAAEIYPQIWQRDDQEGREYVLGYYLELAAFYREAAQRGDAVLAYIN